MFDLSEAYECAKLAGRAYVSPTFKVKNNQGIVIEGNKGYTIALAGTDDITDMIRDLSFLRIKTSDGKIHRGFFQCWEEIKSTVFKKVILTNKPVYITGHSLGGALAVLCALDLFKKGFVIGGVYTFGQPRVGDKKFDRVFNSTGIPLYRLIHGYDMVPRSPKLNYYHQGSGIRLTLSGGLSEGGPNYWNLFDVIMGNLGHHRLELYIKAMVKILSEKG